MSNEKSNSENDFESINSEFIDSKAQQYKPLVSIITPAFNEEAIIKKNIKALCDYMDGLENQYRWELIIINDGSTDKTGDIAEELSSKSKNIRVYHHVTNFGLGQALKFAFNKCKGDFIITMDIDLSYGPEHIEKLLNKISATKAKLVLASPYMHEGTIKNVPFMRKYLSIIANKFLSIVAHGHLSTLTCMVRAYDGPYIRSLNLRSLGMEVMPETIYKSMILRARIVQIPAHLDWGLQNVEGKSRTSSMKVFRHILSTLLSGFIFRPFMFFILPGLSIIAYFFFALVLLPGQIQVLFSR